METEQLDILSKRIDRSLADLRVAELSVKREKKELAESKINLLDALEAQKVLQGVAQTIQTKAHEKIAGIVSRCLSAVFEEPYQFKIIFEQKRGKTEARLIFIQGEHEVDPMSASGGGVVDVAAFALRLSALLLSKPRLRKILILDEPFRFVSVSYRSQVGDIMAKLSEELGVQIIMITHQEEMKIGKVIELKVKSGIRRNSKTPDTANN